MPVDDHHHDHDRYHDHHRGNDHEDRFEVRLGEALHQAGGAYDTDRRALVAAGATRGRRLLLRRRAAVVAGVASVALVGLGGALLVPGGDDGRQSVATGARTPVASATPKASYTGDELIGMLEKLLPRGEFSSAQARGTDDKLPPYAQVVHNDGKGKAAIAVGFDRVLPGSEQARQTVECPDKVLTPYDRCVVTRLSDGSALRIFQGYEYPDRRADTKLWTADLVTPKGQHVSVSEWNAAAEKGAPVSRAEPPLSTARLKTLATAGAWLGVVDAIPVDPRAPTAAPAQPSGIDGRAVTSTLVSLLPKGVKVVAKSGPDSGYAYVVVDDGKGRSLVQINVQPNMSDVEHQLFGADAETLADGTKVVTHKEPGEKGGAGVVMWTADTIRTDGFRVVVSAFNSGSQEAAATRTTPALTTKQLRAIALSAKWRGLG
ncbi:hypothetical protein BX281_4507 [Streptomyces sp. Ag82_O1-15]|uniref:hypothetical protein n=1 Tax=Streptomyces sp. Ag82_O1-15 TaxID=1938855 RepID=UPI000BB0E016|nr:hypothetical protein [Streptomyces sp. Ag82_O1-15]PBC96511.1 hypothetical protein BX281_4507 [Streptomyces sp. Ag82_O1-15]